jgi:ATP-binding cassette, subfamily B, bacterial
LFAFLAYLQMVVWPMRQMARTLTELGKAMVSFGRMREILNQPRESGSGGEECPESSVQSQESGGRAKTPSPQPSPSPPDGGRGGGSVVIRNLTFAYGAGKPVLSDLNLTISAGQTLGILGPSGAGKSTLIHLLLRLYDYEHGSIQLDGRELRDLDRTLVRRQIGAVLQEPFLFSKTLKENIRHGRTEAPDDQIAAAAEMACIHDTIVSFEKGYDTLIGERGVTLSGGQRQRLAIARALVRDPALLIFDDALSAVDSQTEGLILRALEQRRGKRTSILIAHRLGTLMAADQIAVLQHGRIAQLGTHDELVLQAGLYRQLWQIQSAQSQDLERELASV